MSMLSSLYIYQPPGCQVFKELQLAVRASNFLLREVVIFYIKNSISLSFNTYIFSFKNLLLLLCAYSISFGLFNIFLFLSSSLYIFYYALAFTYFFLLNIMCSVIFMCFLLWHLKYFFSL